MNKIKDTLKNCKGMKTTKRILGMCRYQLFTLKDTNGNVTNDMEEVVRAAEKFYFQFYSDQDEQGDGGEKNDSLNFELFSVSMDEVKKALKEMSREEPNGGPTIDLIKDSGNFILKKEAQIYTERLQSHSLQRLKNTTIIILDHNEARAIMVN